MAWAPLVVAGAGAAISAIGQWRAGRQAKEAGVAQRRAAEKQAEILDFNAHVADLQAQDAIERGQQEESRFRQGVRLMMGEQRAGIAASGIDVGFGSAVDVQADTAYLGELDALTLRQNAMREAWGHKVSAVELRKRGKVAREEGVMLEGAGRAAQTAARVGAISGAVLTGGSLLAQRYGFGGSEA
jgi:hypothetical protein